MVLLRRILISCSLFATCSLNLCSALDFYFDAPNNWKLSDPKTYSPTVRVCFVNPQEGYSPSINLAVEKSTLSIDEYVKLSQKAYKRNPLAKWRNLGSFNSLAGTGTLVEIDLTSKAGKGRILQFIVKKEDEFAVLTAASGVNDLKNHLELFKNAFRSLTVTDNLLSLIPDESDQANLQKLLSTLELAQKELPADSLKEKSIPLTSEMKQTIAQIETILSKYHDKGSCWHFLALRQCAHVLDEKSKS